ncbi:oxysterol-binding protein 1-like [Watersipora subatra]|uniref:oxysterol-binding protein 1-like n=1 Tax=Watersipora subatra TaxID=2589382 RepID=UPI00355B3F34
MGDAKGKTDFKGWIYKWTNYIKGYQKRWFVLQNGMLSYYRNQTEMGHTCRGTINLINAIVHTEDSCCFVISNGGSHTFHLKASSEVDRQKWVTALELAKANAIREMEDDQEEENDDPHIERSFDPSEIEQTIRTLNTKLEDLNTCNNLIVNHGTQLQRSLAELDHLNSGGDTSSKMKSINERSTLFRITTNAMINASKEYLDLVVAQGRRWQTTLKREHDERLALQSMVEHLAKQHSTLEHQARSFVNAPEAGSSTPQTKGIAVVSSSDDEDEFEDAVEHPFQFTVVMPSNTTKAHSKGHQRNPSSQSADSFHGFDRQESDTSGSDCEGATATVVSTKMRGKDTTDSGPKFRPNSAKRVHTLANGQSVVQRRKTIPEKPNYSLNLWSIMKNCVGRDLTKIPMPINFNEPLSMLQRLTEEFEYSECLDNAAKCDQWEQMCWLAAFTISAYSTTTTRTGKPFNPLLGETFECDRREDLGWRSLTEQVSHHPPTCAMHATGNSGWMLEQEFTMSSKFRGKYLQIIPLGIAHCKFEGSGNHYTWRKVTTTVHNIIVGKWWVDNHGEMDIINHKTGDKCHLKFSAYSYFSRDIPRKVTGVVTDKSGAARWVVRGTWDEYMEGAKVLSTSQHGSKPVFETGEYKTLWKRKMPPAYLEKCYNLTLLGVEMNEEEEGVAPTDCRLRPDQRLMENAQWDEANKEKQRLEEKQRAARRSREREAELATAEGENFPEYQPAWFKKAKDPITGNLIHLFTNEYWPCKEQGNFSRCPDIY